MRTSVNFSPDVPSSSVSLHSRTQTFLTAFTGSFTCNINSWPFVDSRVWPSTVVAVSVSSCIGPTVIGDPARAPEHDILTVSTGVKIILGSTCNVLLSPAVLTLLVDLDQCFTVLFIQSLVVTPAQFLIEQDTGISHIRFRLSKPHGLDLRLVGLVLISEFLCLGLRQLPFWSVLMIKSSWANLLSHLSLAS